LIVSATTLLPQVEHESAQQLVRAMTSRLMRAENLSRCEAATFLHALADPAVSDAQIAAALVALATKGETVDELAGMAEALRGRAVRLYSRHDRFIDTAGTGSSAAKTFNVSTAAAFVIAGAGLPVAKHGARAATSRCGSADVLETLGVNTAAAPEVTERCLNEHGICFMFAPLFHPATARVANVRRQLGLRTAFNLLGPLSNPARAPFQLLGVSHRSLVERMAAALSRVGIDKAWVVHGADGLDEITVAGETFVAECSANGELRTFTLSPRDLGLNAQALNEVRGSGPTENARIVRAILNGNRAAAICATRDLVIANAAAALHIAGLAPNLCEAAALARDSVETGRAAGKLDALVRETNRKR
jgi:anthranilate phosphoribosyltransferase